MTNYRFSKINAILPGLALGALFGWLLSFPLFGSLLLDTATDLSLKLGLSFTISHAAGFFLFYKATDKLFTKKRNVRATGTIVSLLTMIYAFFRTQTVIDFILIILMGILSSYIILAWANWFASDNKPLLNLTVAMAGANLIYALINAPFFPLIPGFILVSLLAMGSSYSIHIEHQKIVATPSKLKPQLQKMVKTLAAFVVAIYFIGGIWYQNVLTQIAVTPYWDNTIIALMYASGVAMLAYLAIQRQPGNLALYSLSALGIGIIINIAGISTLFLTLSYFLALNFGLAAADLFFWYMLWVLGRFYGIRRVFSIGLGSSLLLIASSTMISVAGWNTNSSLTLYLTALALLFLVIPLIFRYPLQLADASNQHNDGQENLPQPPEILTPQEKLVYTLLIKGASNDEIAASLYISTHTVKFHVRNTLRKLGAKNRKELLSRHIVLNKN